MWQNKVLELCNLHNIECIIKNLQVTFWCSMALKEETKEVIKETVPEKMNVSFRIKREKIIQNEDVTSLRIDLGLCIDVQDFIDNM